MILVHILDRMRKEHAVAIEALRIDLLFFAIRMALGWS